MASPQTVPLRQISTSATRRGFHDGAQIGGSRRPGIIRRSAPGPGFFPCRRSRRSHDLRAPRPDEPCIGIRDRPARDHEEVIGVRPFMGKLRVNASAMLQPRRASILRQLVDARAATRSNPNKLGEAPGIVGQGIDGWRIPVIGAGRPTSAVKTVFRDSVNGRLGGAPVVLRPPSPRCSTTQLRAEAQRTTAPFFG
ncbi:hypothetical protein ACVILH_006449 [Bradyrhizobium sp. USDA 4353]